MHAVSVPCSAPSPRAFAASPIAPAAAAAAVGSTIRGRNRCGPLPLALPLPAPPAALMHQTAGESTSPVSPYANMTFAWNNHGDREEADELARLNQRNYRSLADSVGFDSVVLKQRETDRAVQAKSRGIDVPSAAAAPLSSVPQTT